MPYADGGEKKGVKMVTRLQVTYQSPEVDLELDEKILEFFNTLDFICIDRKYHYIAYKREIFFEKQSKEIADESRRDKKVKLTA